MKKLRYFFRSRLSSGEAGQALIIVLIFLMLGSLTLVPTLLHISTALKTGEVYEKNTNELYTADAGIEDSLWRIKYDFMGADYNPYDFTSSWPYQTEDLNGMTANFTISNIWFPTDVTLAGLGLTTATTTQMMESEKLYVAGSAPVGQPYKILIDFNPGPGDNLTIKSIGVWIPRGFTYNSCSLQDGSHNSYVPDLVTSAQAPGGWTVRWSYNPPYPRIGDFPNYDSQDSSFYLTFNYTPAVQDQLPAAVAWVTTAMYDTSGNSKLNDVPVSWDTDTRYYKIVSQAGDTEIQAYSSKDELRQLGDAMSGDYVAIGNSLMSDDHPDPSNIRDTWHTPSSYNLTSIPADADAVYAYLYWSGWRQESAKVNEFTDDCSGFTNWARLGENPTSVTKVPTGDGISNGTWNTSPYYSKVDETTYNDSDYITGTTDSGGYQLFTFSAFSLPSTAVVTNLTIYFRAKDVSGTNPNNNLYASLRVNGTRYDASSSVDPGAGWTTFNYSFATNPDTPGVAWTYSDINGSGSHPLQQFGIRSTDLNPDIQVSMVYAQVNYSLSLWGINNSEFQGTGSSSTSTDPRTLTLANSLNLTSCTTKTVGVCWEESTQNLESSDALYFAFSGDGGATWSENIQAFSDDVQNDQSKSYKLFCYTIPQKYVTGSFKMRFYFNFNGSDDSVNLDNINLIYMAADTGITFKIGSDQVYFNGSDPAVGPHDLTAGRSYAMLDTMWGVPEGYSYACVRDVSALVKKYPVNPNEQHHTGNANYSVDGVSAELNDNFSFAGWSLIIVYACPESAGHYIYIRDNNFAFHPGTGGDLDFDGDGSPGGTITDFKIPNPITDKNGHIIETDAAKLTVFAVEGDHFTNDTSSIVVTGQQSGNSMSLWNPNSPSPDVINGKSYPGTFNEGVDIDTFELKWSDNILTPGDKSLQVDMYSLNDAWNLVYFIISIRSETKTSGTNYYTIRGG